MTETDTEMNTEYRKQFADLQTSFNINWLVSHLNDIEQIQTRDEFHAINPCINNAEIKLQVSPTFAAQKITKKQEAFGTIGDCLFSGEGATNDLHFLRSYMALEMCETRLSPTLDEFTEP
ncbi:hypothetical protein POM88_002505 [Heracleum sosnowskyi]|uniref:Uncharacterized protein n=1 Tax=Heracleum sosnowskyi TaxID=360622 RepID=A0AAD8N5Z5_9APIA|nr:hypothetical protein POM88_002505 [Heracleum sosnowskyi]